MQDSIIAEEIRQVTSEDEHLSALAEHIHCSWLSTKLRYKQNVTLKVIKG